MTVRILSPPHSTKVGSGVYKPFSSSSKCNISLPRPITWASTGSPDNLPNRFVWIVFWAQYFATVFGVLGMPTAPQIAARASSIALVLWAFVFPILKADNQYLRARFRPLFVTFALGSIFWIYPLHGANDALWLTWGSVVLLSLWLGYRSVKIRAQAFPKAFLMLLVLAGIWSLIDLDLSGVLNYNETSLLPDLSSDTRWNIGPPGSTIHGATTFSAIVCLVSVNGYHITRNFSWLVLSCTSGVVVLLAGSRSILLSLFVSLLIFFVFAYRVVPQIVKVLSTLSLVVIGFYATYFAPSFSQILSRTDLLAEVLRISNSESDVTSGRSWLWKRHIEDFIGNPLGIGREKYRNTAINDVIDGDTALAVNESFFTLLLSSFGFFSFILFAILAALFVLVLSSRDAIKISLYSFALVGTASSSLFSFPHGALLFILGSLLAGKIDYSRSRRTKPREILIYSSCESRSKV